MAAKKSPRKPHTLKPLRATKSEVAAADRALDESIALSDLSRLLAKRDGRAVSLQITRRNDGSACVSVRDGEHFTEASLRHAVNAALAAEAVR